MVIFALCIVFDAFLVYNIFMTQTKKWVTILFVILQTVIFFTFLAGDLTLEWDTSWVKYVGVLLCLFYACAFCKNLNDAFLALALFFTAVADYFLLVINNHFEAGVTVFIVAQIFHFARIATLKTLKTNLISVAARLLLAVVALVLLAVTNNFDTLNCLVAIYFPLLLVNTADALFVALKNKKRILLFVGFCLFVLCDVCVGLYNIDINLPTKLVNAVSFLMWVFYLPSQTLIALSQNALQPT